MQCADEVVVVNNPQPMKAGNSLEEKTERTLCKVMMADQTKRSGADAKDGSSFKMIGEYSVDILKKLEGI